MIFGRVSLPKASNSYGSTARLLKSIGNSMFAVVARLALYHIWALSLGSYSGPRRRLLTHCSSNVLFLPYFFDFAQSQHGLTQKTLLRRSMVLEVVVEVPSPRAAKQMHDRLGSFPRNGRRRPTSKHIQKLSQSPSETTQQHPKSCPKAAHIKAATHAPQLFKSSELLPVPSVNVRGPVCGSIAEART